MCAAALLLLLSLCLATVDSRCSARTYSSATVRTYHTSLPTEAGVQALRARLLAGMAELLLLPPSMVHVLRATAAVEALPGSAQNYSFPRTPCTAAVDEAAGFAAWAQASARVWRQRSLPVNLTACNATAGSAGSWLCTTAAGAVPGHYVLPPSNILGSEASAGGLCIPMPFPELSVEGLPWGGAPATAPAPAAAAPAAATPTPTPAAAALCSAPPPLPLPAPGAPLRCSPNVTYLLPPRCILALNLAAGRGGAGAAASPGAPGHNTTFVLYSGDAGAKALVCGLGAPGAPYDSAAATPPTPGGDAWVAVDRRRAAGSRLNCSSALTAASAAPLLGFAQGGLAGAVGPAGQGGGNGSSSSSGSGRLLTWKPPGAAAGSTPRVLMPMASYFNARGSSRRNGSVTYLGSMCSGTGSNSSTRSGELSAFWPPPTPTPQPPTASSSSSSSSAHAYVHSTVVWHIELTHPSASPAATPRFCTDRQSLLSCQAGVMGSADPSTGLRNLSFAPEQLLAHALTSTPRAAAALLARVAAPAPAPLARALSAGAHSDSSAPPSTLAPYWVEFQGLPLARAVLPATASGVEGVPPAAAPSEEASEESVVLGVVLAAAAALVLVLLLGALWVRSAARKGLVMRVAPASKVVSCALAGGGGQWGETEGRLDSTCSRTSTSSAADVV